MALMKPNFKFKVLGDVFLSPTDLQALTLLYQPIMGVDAFSLYMLFLSLPTNRLQRHHLLLQVVDGSMEHLIETRHRLEGTGLLDVYASDEWVTYVLKQPLSVKPFFSDAIMRAFLYVKIGAQDFNALKKMLVPEMEAVVGDKTTKRFDEVFDIKVFNRLDAHILFNHEVNQVGKGIEVATVFDTSMLSAILIKKGISREIITFDLLKTLNELAFLYKFDVHELARLVFDALIPDGTVDLVRMKYLARTQFQLMSKGEQVKVVVKAEQGATKKPATSQLEQKLIEHLELSPIDFLQHRSGGKTPVPADMKLVEWLHIDQGMPAGVVNVMVDYILDYTGENLPKQFVEKLAGQWQRLRINTTEAAMEQVTNVLKKSKDYKTAKETLVVPKVNLKRATRVEPIPEWLGKVHHEASIDDEATKERIEQMKRTMLNGGAEHAET